MDSTSSPPPVAQSSSSAHSASSSPSATLSKSSANHSSRRPPHLPAVITVPPWARDEPPSPKDEPAFHATRNYPSTEHRQSDAGSYSSNPSQPESRWWTFTLPRSSHPQHYRPPTDRPKKKLRDYSMAWLPTSAGFRDATSAHKEKQKDTRSDPDHNLSEPLPTFTIAHNHTPGWSSPWTPRHNAQGPLARHQESYGFGDDSPTRSDEVQGRKKILRSFIVTNIYVPLLFRFINIAFTTAALGIAIRIRNLELQNSAGGAIGSSPTVVIIFAPLTLVHVIGAIYLEYFGRPLGLWRTSAKLAHTLSEVLFICAWSAALSLCFDNFFTSLIPCAPASSTSWYSEIPRPSNPPDFKASIGKTVCDDQRVLIGVVFVGLVAYCTNLVISLYRIFEKVKYHPVAPLRGS